MVQQQRQVSPRSGPHILKTRKSPVLAVPLRTDPPTGPSHAACALGFASEYLNCLMGQAWALPGEDFQTDVQLAFDMVGDALRILGQHAQDKTPAERVKAVLGKMRADWGCVYGTTEHLEGVEAAYAAQLGSISPNTNLPMRALLKQMPLHQEVRQLHSAAMSAAQAAGPAALRLWNIGTILGATWATTRTWCDRPGTVRRSLHQAARDCAECGLPADVLAPLRKADQLSDLDISIVAKHLVNDTYNRLLGSLPATDVNASPAGTNAGPPALKGPAPGGRTVRRKVPTPLKGGPSPDRQEGFLRVLYGLGSFNCKTHATIGEVLEKSEPGSNPKNFARVVAFLVQHKWIETRDGSAGGCWLTLEGLPEAKRLFDAHQLKIENK